MAPLLSAFFSFSLLSLFVLLAQCAPSPEPSSAFHTIGIHTLMPQNVCSPSQVHQNARGAGLTISPRHGPCSPLKNKQMPDLKKILEKDEARIKYINNRLRSVRSDKSKIPAREGTSLDTADYVVTIGFGSPKKEQSVIFDTGSDLTWIQCKPCVSSCYHQQQPIFNPSQSSTYANISCSSPHCSELDAHSCALSTCVYGVKYGDSSSTQGFLAEDTLTLSSSDVLQKFRFGCGEANSGLFGEVAGLLGLGRDKVSIISQAVQRHGGVFSYCLPSKSSSTGYLTFGGGLPSSLIRTTPMLTNPNAPTFYFLQLVAIDVAGRRLSIPSTVFSNTEIIIDSGTVITRLPPQAYSALRSAFREAMSGYKSAPAVSILDTCYDLTGHAKVKSPTVALQFGGGITINLDPSGILYAVSESQTCLAFAGNGDASALGIIGNVQQRKFNVVYDVSKKLIGFGPNGC